MKVLLILLAVTTVVLLLPYKKINFLKKALSALTVAFAVALAVQAILPSLFPVRETTPVTVSAKGDTVAPAEGSEVWIKSVTVDGKTYSPKDIFFGNWIEKDGSLGWRNYSPNNVPKTIQGKLPVGKNRTIVFKTDKWQGFATVSIGGKNSAVNCYADSTQSGETTYQAPAAEATEKSLITPQIQRYVFAGTLLLVFLLILYLFYRDGKKRKALPEPSPESRKRELWADLLRVFCIFTIVWLHCSEGMYDNFSVNKYTWYNYLYITSFTAFAVPTFFMLSGAFLIGRQESIGTVLKNRVLKLFIPLAAWSFLYILVNKYYWKQDISVVKSILKIPFSSQYWHLWFMYPLLGLYFLLPLITYLYYNLDIKMKRYLLLLVCAVPCVLGTIFAAASAHMPQPWFTLGFPEIGLFVAGKIIVDRKKKFYGKWQFPLVFALFGFGMTVFSSYAMTLKTGSPNKTFISSYGYLPVFLFSVSMFALFFSLEPKWNKISDKMKKIITKLSNLCMGIYFTHMLALAFVGNRYLGPIGFTANTGGNWNMLLGAILYFMVSAMFCYVLSYIPVLWRLGAAKREMIYNIQN